jgi:threonine/homoserine/homoserine lactone efflux protein
MPVFIEYIISAVVLGIIVAIPPGSVTIVSCQRALQFGFKNSLFFTFGSCLSDIFYIILVYYGVARIIADNQLYKMILWIICGVLLIIIGITTFISARDTENNRIFKFQSNNVATFISGIFITLSNPMTIVGWIGIAGNFFLIWNDKFPYSRNLSIISIFMIMVGVLIWFIPLNFAVSKLKKIVTGKLKKYLIIFSSIFLMVFGLAGIYLAIKISFTLG